MNLVFGPLISQILLAALPVMNAAKVPGVGSIGSDQITPQNGPYDFSVPINADRQANAIVAQVEQVLQHGYRPPSICPDTRAAARVRREGTERSGHRLVLELGAACADADCSDTVFAPAMMDRGILTLSRSIREGLRIRSRVHSH